MSFPSWSWCKDYSNLHKGVIVSYVTLCLLLGFMKYSHISYIMILKKGIHLHTLVFSLILLSTSMTNCAHAGGRNLPPRLNTFFFFGSKFYNVLHFTNATTMEVGLATRVIWAKIVDFMKQQCSIVTTSLITKLEW
jgi:hypothetical protein